MGVCEAGRAAAALGVYLSINPSSSTNTTYPAASSHRALLSCESATSLFPLCSFPRDHIVGRCLPLPALRRGDYIDTLLALGSHLGSACVRACSRDSRIGRSAGQSGRRGVNVRIPSARTGSSFTRQSEDPGVGAGAGDEVRAEPRAPRLDI